MRLPSTSSLSAALPGLVRRVTLGCALGALVAAGLLLVPGRVEAACAAKGFAARFDDFNASLMIGQSRYVDTVRGVEEQGQFGPIDEENKARGFAFATDFLFPLEDSPWWLGLSFTIATGSTAPVRNLDSENVVTHGSLSFQVRYNLYDLYCGDSFPYLAVEAGWHSQSFRTERGGLPLRVSADGPGGGAILGVQSAVGVFMHLHYQTFYLDNFDIQLRQTSGSATTEKPDIVGSVEGSGWQLVIGYRWF